MILNKEWGLAKNENPNQGAFVIEQLTDLVEEAVLKEFDAISARGGEPVPEKLELIRSTEAEKQSQLKRLRDFHKRHAKDAVRVCSLGQITRALFEVGGQYRRSMRDLG